MSQPCPCNPAHTYASCCQPLHHGAAATDPQALMRSRYSAYVLGLVPYLLASWDASTRPLELTLEPALQWLRLELLSQHEEGDQGQVHYRAHYRHGTHWGVLEEQSRFRRDHGHWRYVDGAVQDHPVKPGRNLPCPCGSGRKFKQCCG